MSGLMMADESATIPTVSPEAVEMDPGDALDRFTVVVDPNAEPCDWDEALAEFLLAYVRTAKESQVSPPGLLAATRHKQEEVQQKLVEPV